MSNTLKNNNMLNFTVGPVMSNDYVLKIGSEHTPYFRTEEFSNIMLETERLIKKFVRAGDDSRAVFLTGSGTAAMEAAVVNLFNKNDSILIINGGSFGGRFVEICELYGLNYTEILLSQGQTIKKHDLEKYEGKGYTGFLVNVHETSTGVYYDLNIISEFCTNNNIFLVVDAISSFLADPIDMTNNNIGALITSSQKVLACPPGISIIVLSNEAIKKAKCNTRKCLYLDLKSALENGVRGQTPFTPAVTILLQIHERLKNIDFLGGADVEINRIKALADDFRQRIRNLPFEIASEHMSNAVTPLKPNTQSAHEIFLKLKDEYNIWVCPNGGEYKDTLFRVGHIGALTISDNDILINAFNDLKRKGFI